MSELVTCKDLKKSLQKSKPYLKRRKNTLTVRKSTERLLSDI